MNKDEPPKLSDLQVKLGSGSPLEDSKRPDNIESGEVVAEEEEKLREIKEGETTAQRVLHHSFSNDQVVVGAGNNNNTARTNGISANDLSSINQKQQDNTNDKSLQIVADISDIMAETVPNKQSQATPAFKDKNVVNFYEDAAEDLSMLKDIISHRSVTEETNLLLQQQQ